MRTFALLSDDGLPGLTLHADRLEDCYGLLKSYNDRLGYSVFETVNEMDGEGRSLANVKKLTSFYADCDNGFPSIPYPIPTYVVCSSPGKYQLFWRLVEPVAATPQTCALYGGIQAALVKNLGADSKAKDITRILRVPGFYNRKAKYAPTFPMVYSMSGTVNALIRYTMEQMQAAFGFDQKAAEAVNAVESFDQPRGLAQRSGEAVAIAALRKACERKPPPSSGRNPWCYELACFSLVQLGLSVERTCEILEEYCPGYDTLDLTVQRANKYARRKSLGYTTTEIDL